MKKLKVRDLFSTSKREESVRKLRVALSKYMDLLKKTREVNTNREIGNLVALQDLIREAYPATTQGINFRLLNLQEEDPFLGFLLQMPQKGENPTEVMRTNLRITNARIDDINNSGHEVNSRVGRALEKIREKIGQISETAKELQYRFRNNTLIVGMTGALVSVVAALEKNWIATTILALGTAVVSGIVEIKRRLNLHKKVEQILLENHEEVCVSMERALEADVSMHAGKVARAEEGVEEMIRSLLPRVSEETGESAMARIRPIPRY